MAQSSAQSSLATNIEPYRKGAGFTEWAERLEYLFSINAVKEEHKKAYLATLGGPVVYSELKLLYPNTDLNTIAYRDMISKLKARFDKVAPDIIQRLNFNNRMQQKDESVEDFVLAVKLQAEFCTFGDYKSIAIRDRVIAGIRDKALQQRLLNEENLTLATAEKNHCHLGGGRSELQRFGRQ